MKLTRTETGNAPVDQLYNLKRTEVRKKIWLKNIRRR